MCRFVVLLLSWSLVYPTRVAARSDHLILITMDGMAAYQLDDEKLEIPNLRELLRNGVRALSSETVFPSATHPSHTTLVTGVWPKVHGVLANKMTNRVTHETFSVANLPHAQSVKVLTLFDAAKKKGLTTASFFWPETYGDVSIDYNLAERDDLPEADLKPQNAEFLSELRRAGIPLEFGARYYGDPQLQIACDIFIAEAAAETIRKHQPNLVTIHFLFTDKVQHTYGPDHYLAKAAISEVDRCIGIVRSAVRAAGLQDETTFVVAADHGFTSVSQEINLYPLFKEAGLLDRVSLHLEKWVLSVELKKTFNQQTDTPKLEEVFKKAAAVPGVNRIIRSEEYPSYGLPRYEDNPHIPGQYMIVANIDCFLAVDPSDESMSMLPRAMPKVYHGHGYLPQHPRMFPMLLLSGNHVLKGKQIGHVHNLDVAPTIAQLLGLKMEGLSGRVLQEALEASGKR